MQLSLAQNHSSEAQVYAQELVQGNPADVNDRLLLGGIYLREGRFRPAEQQFGVANQLAPSQASAHINLGLLNAKEKNWTQAEKEFETAIRLDPSDPAILSAYADFLVTRQQTPRAIARVQQFVDANPTNAQGHVMLGVLQFGSKNSSAAQAEFERAVQIDPSNVQAHLRLADVYQERNQTDAALGDHFKTGQWGTGQNRPTEWPGT